MRYTVKVGDVLICTNPTMASYGRIIKCVKVEGGMWFDEDDVKNSRRGGWINPTVNFELAKNHIIYEIIKEL